MWSVYQTKLQNSEYMIYSSGDWQRRRQPPRSGGGGRDIWGSGGEAPGKFFGATPFKTLGNAHFEDRNTPF